MGSMSLKERLEHAYYCERDMEYRKAFLAMCQQDPVFFINACLWTFDPRLDGADRFIPFLLFDQQEDFARFIAGCIKDGHDGLCDKSRDTGASWVALAVIFWAWLFQPSFMALLGSRKEDYVDKANDASCLMWKLDEMYRSLPEWMKIPGYTATKPWRTHLVMANPLTGSVITGESANPNFGRGGRYSIIFFDEGAFWDNMRSAYTSSSESTKCRMMVSTPNGMNFFGKLANPAKPKPGQKQAGPRRFQLHWSLDPRHTIMKIDDDPTSPTFGKEINPWLEAQRLKYSYDPEMMAQELDIDYRSSVKGRYYPQIDFTRQGTFAYDPSLPLYTSWDFGTTDETAIIWWQFDVRTLRYRIIDSYSNKGKSIAFYVPFVTGLLPGDTEGETYTPYDLEVVARHTGWRYTAHFGDPAGRQVAQTSNTSVIDELHANRIYVTCNYKANTHQARRDATKRMLLRMDIDEERCEQFIEAIRNSKYPKREEGHQNTAANNKPVHDEYSHFRSALEYAAVNDPHRYDLEDRREGINVTAQQVGAVFGDTSRIIEEIDPWDADDSSLYAGVGKAGY